MLGLNTGKMYAVQTRNVSPAGNFLWCTYVDSPDRKEMEDVFSRMVSEALSWHEVRLVEMSEGRKKIIKRTKICQK